jgi:hypothetical protein
MKNLYILSLAGIVSALSSACLYDADARCSPGEILNQDQMCVCADNHVPLSRDIKVVVASDPTAATLRAGCEACGENEIAQGEACVCVDGFVKSGDACVASNLGALCASNDDCAAGDNTYCKMPAGYCTTSGCATDEECNASADFACDRNAPESYCRRPPIGQGMPCTAMGIDPACPAESPMCVLNTCNPVGCTGETDCSPSRTCCDLSAFAGQPLTLCMGGCP